MTLLLAANTRLGGAMVLALLFVDRPGAVAWLMVGAGLLMIYTALGCLSREVPRFRTALGLSIIACVISVIATFTILSRAAQLEQKILSSVTPANPVVVVHIESEGGGGQPVSGCVPALRAWRGDERPAAERLRSIPDSTYDVGTIRPMVVAADRRAYSSV